MDSQKNDFSAGEVTHQSVNAEIKLATEQMLQQVEKLSALLPERNELQHTTRSSEATGSRREDPPASSADSRYDNFL